MRAFKKAEHLFDVIRTCWSIAQTYFNKAEVRMTKLLECTRVLTCLFLLLTSVVCLADDTSLWKIQRTLAGKKYIDLTHEFAPGIPRWPGFPDETRKTIYWYDKRPDC